MSGGFFDYENHRIDDVANKIANVVKFRGTCSDADGDEIHRVNFSEETFQQLQTGLAILRVASIYAHRIDWLLSGDDGEESFHQRLNEELEEIQALVANTNVEWMTDGPEQYLDVCLNNITEEKFDEAAQKAQILIVTPIRQNDVE